MNWLLVLHAVEFFLWVAVGLYSWQVARHRATHEDIAGARREIQKVDLRLTRIEERVEHLPDSESFRVLSENLATLTGGIEGFREQVAGIKHQYERIEDYLRTVHR